MRPNQAYKPLHSKGNHKQLMDWEKYLQMMWPIRAEYPKYTKSSYSSMSKDPKQLNQKMSRKPIETFLQRIQTDGQQAHEKILNITNY